MVKVTARITANAIVPDQLLPYVKAVSGLETRILQNGILHFTDDQGVLVVYPEQDSHSQEIVNAATDEALAFKSLKHIAVIAPQRPSQAPANAVSVKDAYWSLPLPYPPVSGKTENMLRRARRQITVEADAAPQAWLKDHTNLVNEFCADKAKILDDGSVFLFRQLQNYIREVPDAVLFSARNKNDNKLVGLTIGDYSAFGTAFYMFAMRSQDAPPGTADLLLSEFLEGAEKRGHTSVNLGLGINKGIEFFKKKWGARISLTFVETNWEIEQKKKKSWFLRLFKT